MQRHASVTGCFEVVLHLVSMARSSKKEVQIFNVQFEKYNFTEGPPVLYGP